VPNNENEDSEYHSSSSDGDESDSDSESDVNCVEDELDNEVFAHGTQWTFGERKLIDNYVSGKYEARLLVRDDISVWTEVDFWRLFFPSENIDKILRFTNAGFNNTGKPVDEVELFKVFGILYAMTLFPCSTRRDYLSVNTDAKLFPPLAFSKRFNMGLHRFESILMNLSFGPKNEEDKWSAVRPLVDALNDKWRAIINPGYKLTVDESMFSWLGQGQCSKSGMPAVMKIKRKPKGIGCEVKTLADSCSQIMLRMELHEGQEVMSTKPHQKELGAGTGTLLRLTEPWYGSGRVVVGDSWFGSVKATDQLFERGLHFIGMVKTATRNYPLKEMKRRCPNTRGASIRATAQLDAGKQVILAMAWTDKKVHSLVSSCGTTHEGTPAKKHRIDHEGSSFVKMVPRPLLFETYFDGAPAIDIHNHIRQDGLALEAVWGTHL